ncbi:MAG: trehalose-6-phosphate synthase [Betaproteobacteria bacterium]|nr:trehalose-6-phosphate synthase [Betaproteobacteria bacterium]MDH5285641.1 trehalose-6-phosphate synthase [Betaproteobacteria bacterium]
MRLSLRFLIPLLLALGVFAYAAVPLVDGLMLRWFVRDLDIRANLVANAAQDPLVALVDQGSPARLTRYFARLLQDERMHAMALCLPGLDQPISSPDFPAGLRCSDLERYGEGRELRLFSAPHGPLHVAAKPLDDARAPGLQLVLVHDMSFVDRRSEETRRYLFVFFVALSAIVALITVVIAQLSWRGWVHGLRALLRGEGIVRPASAAAMPELRPLARDVRELVRQLEQQYRPRDDSQLAWTPQALRAILEGELSGHEVIVVSNREPYIHVQTPAGVRVQRPASGLVTALEPVMRACSGTWIAHGSGSADRATVDLNDRIDVPPDAPAYKLRRIWLSPEEEAGYYSGFANEGLWPLCHIAHVRPTFRSADFEHYRAVNERFAEAVVDEAKSPDPIVLVQDYHFALLPRMVRDRLPNATIIAFWHIPWPNPEAFAICPWRNELLDGMLGSSILGFHTQFHCNNFLDTVDRLLEARVDRESFTVTFRGSLTAVHRYPISIEWPPQAMRNQVPVDEARRRVRERFGLPANQFLGIGVERLDYTKGVLERFRAVGRLLEIEPQWIGRFTFVQIAAPTRGMIGDYRDYGERVKVVADEINARFPQAAHPPIVLLTEHHEPEQVYEYLRAAELCFVSSLHDGMNLVAKEFIASRDDERGVLLLSQFAGASRELPEALIVNPYDADQCAAALHVALTMPADEQRARMRLMRGLVAEFNVYRWAGRMLIDAAAMRQRSRLSRYSRDRERLESA